MFSFMKKNKDAVKKYLLIFFLGIVSLSMVVVMAPLPSGDTSTPRRQCAGFDRREHHYQCGPGSNHPRPVQELTHGLRPAHGADGRAQRS